MGHVILLEDSNFDNVAYVPGQPDVIQQMRAELPKEWSASLLGPPPQKWSSLMYGF
jgi:hypothetical protein